MQSLSFGRIKWEDMKKRACRFGWYSFAASLLLLLLPPLPLPNLVFVFLGNFELYSAHCARARIVYHKAYIAEKQRRRKLLMLVFSYRCDSWWATRNPIDSVDDQTERIKVNKNQRLVWNPTICDDVNPWTWAERIVRRSTNEEIRHWNVSTLDSTDNKWNENSIPAEFQSPIESHTFSSSLRDGSIFFCPTHSSEKQNIKFRDQIALV